ncbi:uncharacterized protein SETTUDRAFT_34108 [Exserohilum turcica Et28A]|uniref:Cytochrome P450 n=1 Tax=Exserohilum turcicum (strain 28A) TaxID=671987 RepID=R0IAU9_EXST2|nr:uncharacterized protein SETTUDRAFT_34108 [Exserohilum turcica Et28A]EOA82545.1 hypothetical protein SETTUDRAFT_34108 [Exserohilum turcica Et28A]
MSFDFLFGFRTWTLVFILASTYLFRSRRRSPFPPVNQYPGDFLNRKAYREYSQNAESLIAQGLAKHKGPITLRAPNAEKIILPASLTAWVKSNKDLDHRELVRQDFYAGLPGFEVQDALHSRGDLLLDMVRTKLGQNDSIMPTVNASLAKAMQIHFGEGEDWHPIDWQKDTTGIISRAASSIFIGPELCDDPEWLEIIQGYVGAFFTAVNELHAYPAWTRPIVQRFLPNAANCRKYMARARVITKELLEKRQKEIKKAQLEGRAPPEYNDALTWTQAVSDSTLDPGEIQLSLAMAALFTTSELFRQVLIDIASNPSIIEPLKQEILQQISTHGITVAATNNMVLMDSVLKESQRLSAACVGLERVALKDLTMPDGNKLPRGSHIMVDCQDLWNPAGYPNPEQFDGYRFLRKREAGDKFSQFVQSGPDYSVFGGGRHTCPGRYFANNELKLAMAHILLKYDIRVANSHQSKPMQMGVYRMVDPVVPFEVYYTHIVLNEH